MQGRLRAALVVAAFAIAAVALPPLVIISGAVLALVTLRRGPVEGALVVAIALAGGGVLAALALGAPGAILGYVVLLWLPVWALSALLRATVSLSLTLSVLAAAVAVGLAFTYLALGDPAAWWQEALGQIVPIVLQNMDAQIPEEVVREQIAAVAPSFTGLVASQLAALVLLSLLLGRWWQAQLYNPGGFGEEFRALRMDQTVAVVSIVIFAGATLTGQPFLVNLALALSIVLGLFGLSVVHAAVNRAGKGRGWLIALYVGMAFLMYPVLAVLALVGAADKWLDLRRRLSGGRGPTE